MTVIYSVIIFCMTLLQIFFIISGVIILLLAIDVARRERFNALHFLVFILVGAGLLIFTFFPQVLNGIGKIFGVQRGADVLVYTSIVFLMYFVLLLLRKVEWSKDELTGLVREIAIRNGPCVPIQWHELILIRAYNEWSVIKETLQELLEYHHKHILVVDDGSDDNTVAKVLSLNSPCITLISHYKNRWWWAALETGFEYIRRYGEVDYVVTFDADGQHDVNDLKDIKKHIEEHKKVDVFLGSRFLWKRTVGIPLMRKIILKLWIIFTAFISQVKLSDAHNGLRVFRRPVLDNIHLTIDDMWYASELVDIIAEKKISYKEIPVNIIYTDYSLSKGQRNGNAINIALKVIWNKFFK